MPVPLLIHLVFHPTSSSARELARQFRRDLNCDPRVPGLRVPTVNLVEADNQLPPANFDLGSAERNVVILFADDAMLFGKPGSGGQPSWSEFAAQVAQLCRAKTNNGAARHRFLPVQLSEASWPLHQDLASINAARVYQEPASQQAAWLQRRLIIEIIRFLENETRGAVAPLTVFVSHAKLDSSEDTSLFCAVKQHLDTTQPVKAWIDTGQIETGGDFEQAIELGVKEAAVLILGTTHYSTRSWCRREVLFAKKHSRPVVVLDGLDDVDVRSFPYLGNVPVVAWADGGARRGVDVLLKEALRMAHVRRVLEAQKRDGDTIFVSPPELLTLSSLPPNKLGSVLYPDPPLGDEETAVLAQLDHPIATPLQRAAQGVSLRHLTIAMSISESDDCERQGLFADQLNEALREISRHLLVRGAALAYGGHLGSEGYTAALLDLVRAHETSSGLPPAQRIVSYVAWPRRIEHEDAKGRYLMRFATYVTMPRPDGLEAIDPRTFVPDPPTRFAPDSPARRFAWARGLTEMRQRQSRETHARIVLGGKIGIPGRWYSGRIPGVMEEAWLTLEVGRPLYICGAYGGGARVLIDLLEGRPRPEFTWEYQRQAEHSDGMRELYTQSGLPWLDYDAIVARLRALGVDGLSASNGLSPEQNRELFVAREPTRTVELILLGLSHVEKSHAG